MAFIDYGVIAKVNGKIINNNDDYGLYYDECIPEYVKFSDNLLKKYNLHDNPVLKIKDRNTVCCGDNDIFLGFYKSNCEIYQNGELIEIIYPSDMSQFISQTFYIGETRIKISHINTTKTKYDDDSDESMWKSFVKNNYAGATGNERYWELENGKNEYRRILRKAKKKFRNRNKYWEFYYGSKYLAEWESNGNKYEVVFGYGIDIDKDVFERIVTRKNNNPYDYTETEIEFIREFYKEN